MAKRVDTFRERSLVILKPDGVQRGLIGEVISRFEKAGLKIVGAKMDWPTKEQSFNHYDVGGDEARIFTGTKTIEAYQKQGVEIKETPLEVGRRIQRLLIDYLSSGPVFCMVVEGISCIKIVRKIVGGTEPYTAEMGSIRGDYSHDSYRHADTEERPVRNMVHASGNKEEADQEIPLWFTEDELMKYTLISEKIMYGPELDNAQIDKVLGMNE
jgi:nucleoside-diphosphate kinase